MGFREITLNLPTGYTEEELKDRIKKNLGVRDFFHQIENKSLDARKKDNIHWKIRVSVISEQISGENPVQHHPLEIPYKKRNKKAVVAGSGPAGFFSALV
ncbi:MAG TPA: FAD-dependent oxidoreductase, partial [Desulfobacteraceae bacterium]|nr:FAD-dependent oxidoreductase [Desulfobacteraceae bacterium]